jgi:hypothetical protein
MNSYTFEDPITTFTGGGFTNLARQFGGLGAYSYVFDGESGYLDHALASASLASQATGTTHWHINADEPIALDYNVEFKTPNQVNTFYDSGPYRASDHDPVVIGCSGSTAPPPWTQAARTPFRREAPSPWRQPETIRTATRSRTNGISTTTARFETAGQSVMSMRRRSNGPGHADDQGARDRFRVGKFAH